MIEDGWYSLEAAAKILKLDVHTLLQAAIKQEIQVAVLSRNWLGLGTQPPYNEHEFRLTGLWSLEPSDIQKIVAQRNGGGIHIESLMPLDTNLATGKVFLEPESEDCYITVNDLVVPKQAVSHEKSIQNANVPKDCSEKTCITIANSLTKAFNEKYQDKYNELSIQLTPTPKSWSEGIKNIKLLSLAFAEACPSLYEQNGKPKQGYHDGSTSSGLIGMLIKDEYTKLKTTTLQNYFKIAIYS